MSQYCAGCNRFIESQDGNCQDCGNALRPDHTAGPYVSGLPLPPGSIVILSPGTVLQDRFTIKEHLGNGRFGSVYLAHDIVRSTDMAIKVVSLGPTSPDIASRQLQQEIGMYGRIKDKHHVIDVHDIHFVPRGGSGLLLMSMEYADGSDFRRWLLENHDDCQKRQIEGLVFFKQACHGVGALHDVSVCHLDLKPENLLFVDKVLKVSDLGASRFVDLLQRVSGVYLNEFGSSLSTPIYMSPEQFTSPHPDDVDGRSDIYSLGIILYEILHPRCRPPFGGSYRQIRERHLNIPAPLLAEAGENEARVIAMCLKKDPTDRYATVWELLDDLAGNTYVEPRAELVEDDGRQEIKHEQIVKLWQQARECLAEKNFNQTIAFCEQLLKICPDHKKAEEMLREMRRKFQKAEKLYGAIERGLDSQSLDLLESIHHEAMSIYPDHPGDHPIQMVLSARVREAEEYMKEGLAALRRGMWQAAQLSLERAQRINPSMPGVGRAVEYACQVRQKVDKALQSIEAADGGPCGLKGGYRSLLAQYVEFMKREDVISYALGPPDGIEKEPIEWLDIDWSKDALNFF